MTAVLTRPTINNSLRRTTALRRYLTILALPTLTLAVVAFFFLPDSLNVVVAGLLAIPTVVVLMYRDADLRDRRAFCIEASRDAVVHYNVRVPAASIPTRVGEESLVWAEVGHLSEKITAVFPDADSPLVLLHNGEELPLRSSESSEIV